MKTSFLLRPLVPDDAALLREILYVALWDPPKEPRRPRSLLDHPQIAAYIEAFGTRSHDLGFAAVTEDGCPAGAVMSRLMLPPLAGGAFFDEVTPQLGIGIFDEFQGHGLGTRLMQTHLQAARGRFARLSLGVHPENVRARRLYERCGFVPFALGLGGYINMVVHLGDGAGTQPAVVGNGPTA